MPDRFVIPIPEGPPKPKFRGVGGVCDSGPWPEHLPDDNAGKTAREYLAG